MKRHTPQTAAATALLLACGTGLLVLSRHRGVGSDLLSQLAAMAGPMGLVLGIGMAIHGRAMPPTHITTPARLWGILGSVAAVVNFWTLQYFEQGGRLGRPLRLLVPVALVVAWLLPKRFYGDSPSDQAEAEGHSRDGAGRSGGEG